MNEAAAIVDGLRRATAKAKRDEHEDALAFQIRAHRLPEPARQHRFALELDRQWRFDFAFLEYRLAVEVEGLVAMRAMVPRGRGQPGYRQTIILTGRHATPEGFKEDVEKYNAATLLGWRLLRVHQDLIKNGGAIAAVERALHAFGWRRPASSTTTGD